MPQHSRGSNPAHTHFPYRSACSSSHAGPITLHESQPRSNISGSTEVPAQCLDEASALPSLSVDSLGQKNTHAITVDAHALCRSPLNSLAGIVSEAPPAGSAIRSSGSLDACTWRSLLPEAARTISSVTSQPSEGQAPAESTQAHQADEDDDLNGLDELVVWSHPEFPDISTELQALISNTYIYHPRLCHKEQLYVKPINKNDQPTTVFRLSGKFTKVKTIRNLAVQEMVRSLFFRQETLLITAGT